MLPRLDIIHLTPFRHSREGGNPVSFHERRWAPAFAGATKTVT